MSYLKTENLTKDYGGGKGVFDINLSVASGEFVGFIGPNGAGKSTTLNMCAGLVKPSKGNISIFDKEVDHLSIHKTYPKIGLLLSETNFDKNLTPKEIFIENETLYNKVCQPLWMELSELLEIDLHKPFGGLSLGNRKKIGIVNSLMHNPDLIIMDEPTNGLDPLIQQNFLKYLREKVKNGSGVFLSSHVLGEVQVFCEKIIMIKAGKIILEDTTENILNKAKRLFRIKNVQQGFINTLEGSNLVSKMEKLAEETLIYTSEYEAILKLLLEASIYDFYLERPSLEKMFLELY